jgi:hypothetical protein
MPATGLSLLVVSNSIHVTQLQLTPLIKFQQGMATLMATSILLLLSGMWGWLSLKSVMAETTRSQHQMQAAQALAASEALLETAMAYTEQLYVQQGESADKLLWTSANPKDCPTNLWPDPWQCLQLNLTLLPLPLGTDESCAQVKLIRDQRNAPHKVILMAEVTLGSTQPGMGSRATVQQALFVPVKATGTEFDPTLWPTGIAPTRVQRVAGSWKNAGY